MILVCLVFWIAVGVFTAICLDVSNEVDTTAMSIFLGSLMGIILPFFLIIYMIFKHGDDIVVLKKKGENNGKV